MVNGQLLAGFALGVAATLVVRSLVQSQAQGGHPLVRAAGRTASLLSEKFQETSAELGEVFEDTIAELQAPEAAPPERSDYSA